MKHLLLLTLVFSISAHTQTTKKVCFLGNSYTYTNDLPGMILDLATADGNTLVKDQNTPGGYTLEGHSTNSTSLAKIAADNWDYVVLQDQSQLPSFPWSQVQTDVLPFAAILVDSIRSANPCAVPLFFNTWGRLNGDPQWDSINTFDKMNQRLFNAYGYIADLHSGKRAPVGIAYNHIQDDSSPPITHPELYVGDGSHPTIFGTYLAACIFYELIFNETCVGNTHIPSGITSTQATYLQNVADHVNNDIDSVEIDFTIPEASFSYQINGNDVTFTNNSKHSFNWTWDFGDSSTSYDFDPIHTYSANGNYSVTLTANYCGNSDDTTTVINFTLGQEFNSGFQFKIVPNPSNGHFEILYNGTEEFAEIWSADGQLLFKHHLGEPLPSVEKSGLYFVKIGTAVQRLIIL